MRKKVLVILLLVGCLFAIGVARKGGGGGSSTRTRSRSSSNGNKNTNYRKPASMAPHVYTQRPPRRTQRPHQYTTKRSFKTTLRPAYTTLRPAYTTLRPAPYNTLQPAQVTRIINNSPSYPSGNTLQPIMYPAGQPNVHNQPLPGGPYIGQQGPQVMPGGQYIGQQGPQVVPVFIPDKYGKPPKGSKVKINVGLGIGGGYYGHGYGHGHTHVIHHHHDDGHRHEHIEDWPLTTTIPTTTIDISHLNETWLRPTIKDESTTTEVKPEIDVSNVAENWYKTKPAKQP